MYYKITLYTKQEVVKKIASSRQLVKVLRTCYLEGIRELPELCCLQDLFWFLEKVLLAGQH